MIRRCWDRFLIEKIINHSYYAYDSALALLRQPFIKYEQDFLQRNSRKYFECKFYGHLSSQFSPKQYVNKFEQQKYNEAVKAMKVFNDVLEVVEAISEFGTAVNHMTIQINYKNNYGNILTPKWTEEDYEKQLIALIDKYHSFLEAIEDYPEWKIKVEEQIGSYFLQIYNNMLESDSKQRIFSKMNRHKFFI